VSATAQATGFKTHIMGEAAHDLISSPIWVTLSPIPARVSAPYLKVSVMFMLALAFCLRKQINLKNIIYFLLIKVNRFRECFFCLRLTSLFETLILNKYYYDCIKTVLIY
jgi:hypothetical protein